MVYGVRRGRPVSGPLDATSKTKGPGRKSLQPLNIWLRGLASAIGSARKIPQGARVLAKKVTPPRQRGELFAHLCGSDEDKCACFRDNHSAPIRPILSNSRLGGSGAVAANVTMGAGVSSLLNVPNAGCAESIFTSSS